MSSAYRASARSSAASSSSFENVVLMKSSCRAPALKAIAFQPFVVGTVTRTLTGPRASRTCRMTPGHHRPYSPRMIGQQLLEQIPDAVDDAVLDLEFVLRRAQPHGST